MLRGEERANLWTRATEQINVGIWRTPLPRRVKVLLSQIAYKNPPISQERMLEAMEVLDGASVNVVLIGGWGVDALVGRQLRSHADLDLVIESGQLTTAVEALGRLGFDLWHSCDDPCSIGKLSVSNARALRDGALRVVELHEADLSQVRTISGTVANRRVSCLPAEEQLQAQEEMGRTWTRQRRLRRQRNFAALSAVDRVIQQDYERA